MERLNNFDSGNGGQCRKRVILESGHKDRLPIAFTPLEFGGEFNVSGGGYGVGRKGRHLDGEHDEKIRSYHKVHKQGIEFWYLTIK